MKYQEYEVTIKLGGMVHTMVVSPGVSKNDWQWMTLDHRREHIYRLAKEMVLELTELDLKEFWDIDHGYD